MGIGLEASPNPHYFDCKTILSNISLFAMESASLFCFLCGGILLISIIPTVIAGVNDNWLIFFWFINFGFILVSFVFIFFLFMRFEIDFGIEYMFPGNSLILENGIVIISLTISTLIDTLAMIVIRRLSKTSRL